MSPAVALTWVNTGSGSAFVLCACVVLPPVRPPLRRTVRPAPRFTGASRLLVLALIAEESRARPRDLRARSDHEFAAGGKRAGIDNRVPSLIDRAGDKSYCMTIGGGWLGAYCVIVESQASGRRGAKDVFSTGGETCSLSNGWAAPLLRRR
jgi:hypothetical protein